MFRPGRGEEHAATGREDHDDGAAADLRPRRLVREPTVRPSADRRRRHSAAHSLPSVPEGAGTGDAALALDGSAWMDRGESRPRRCAARSIRVPGKAGDGECAVFCFGPGQGGDPMSNAVRWAEQFTLADGSGARSTMKTSEIEAGGLKILMVEVAGTYKGGMTMTAAPAVPQIRLPPSRRRSAGARRELVLQAHRPRRDRERAAGRVHSPW